MKIVVAMDSFKGSLTSMEAGEAVKKGILAAVRAQVTVKPLADGGEGTVTALTQGLGGRLEEARVTGPAGGKLKAVYGIIGESRTAVIEMAQAAGLPLIGEGQRQPLKATTLGVGEIILHAIERGCREFLIGIGGSATTDGGIGMLTALGYEFLDKDGVSAGIGADALFRVEQIRTDRAPAVLEECCFKTACDVNNPLCGRRGAVYVYGPQKGVTKELLEPLDAAMGRYADLAEAVCGRECRNMVGAGAAGGLGFALMAFLNARLEKGAKLVQEAVGLRQCLKEADLLVTGEGRMDGQTAMGKAPLEAARTAKEFGLPVIALAGSLSEDAVECNQSGIDACFSILREPVTLAEAMDTENSRRNLERTAEQVFRAVRAVSARERKLR